MDYSHIVELLVKNIGIDSLDLYNISGNKSKREFITEVNFLLANHRIIKQYNPEYIKPRYSPKVLNLSEHEKTSNAQLNKFNINFIPTPVLEKEFGYENNGTEQEDCLEFELQITGYKIRKIHKPYFEKHSGLSLNFDKFNYFLWAQFLDPFPT